MPTFTTAKLPKPKSWNEFEDIVADIAKEIWNFSYIVRNGRIGQRQDGVDIYGKPPHLNNEYAGIQCKDTTIDIKVIEDEIKKAEKFEPPLKEFIFAIASERDSVLQKEVRKIDYERIKNGKFTINIVFWEDICLSLSSNRDLMVKHFPQFVEATSSLGAIRKKIMESVADDWLFDDEKGIYTYKKDTNLTIRRFSYKEERPFIEEWVEKFPDKRGMTFHHDIYYNNSYIERIYIVAVDGYRSYIPLPSLPDMTINKYQYAVGKIINRSPVNVDRLGGFDNYLQRAGIKVL